MICYGVVVAVALVVPPVVPPPEPLDAGDELLVPPVVPPDDAGLAPPELPAHAVSPPSASVANSNPDTIFCFIRSSFAMHGIPCTRDPLAARRVPRL